MSLESENNQPDEDDELSYAVWEKDNIISNETKDAIETMWEIPQICHFFYETKEALDLPEISIYEVERMLLVPKASKLLAAIMTCLLCPSNMKSKLRKIPSMPYKFWTDSLLQKCKHWFEMYQNNNQDAIKVLEAIGIEPTFWKIFPDISYIENTDFEKLTLKQKVWLLKTLCDTLMVSSKIKSEHTRETIKEEMTKHTEKAHDDMILGTDKHGNTYFYLNQFSDKDLRIYKHNVVNKIFSSVKFPISSPITEKKSVSLSILPQKEESKSQKTANEKTEVKHTRADKPRRKRGWKNGILPKNKKKYRLRKLVQLSQGNGVENGCLTDESRCSSSASFCNDSQADLVVRDVVDGLVTQISENESKEIHVKYQTSFKCNSDLNTSGNDFQTRLTESPKCDEKMDDFFKTGERKDFWNVEPGFLICNFGCEHFQDHDKLYRQFFSKFDVETNDEFWEKENIHLSLDNILRDIDDESFELVADSVESLRDFIAILVAEHMASDFKVEDKYKIACEHKLMQKLCQLAENLQGKETVLIEMTKKARKKLCQELSNYRNGVEEDSNWIGENGTMFNWWLSETQNTNFIQSDNEQSKCEESNKHIKQENDSNRERSKDCQHEKHDDTKTAEVQNEGNRSKDVEPQNKRVLRTRGVSSYTGHFYSDEDSEENNAENDWLESTQHNPKNSISFVDPSQSQMSDSQSDRDSDQEWIMPGDRKKKKKRPLASRRMKSLQQHKIQLIPMNSIMANQSFERRDASDPLDPSKPSNFADEMDVKPDINKINLNVNVQPLKKELERVDSIHSELDIPEEKPPMASLAGPTICGSANSTAPHRRKNIPVVASNVAIAPIQFSPQYRTPARQPMGPRSLGPQIYNGQMVYRPRTYRGVVTSFDPRVMQPRGLPLASPQMPAPRGVLMRPQADPRQMRPQQLPPQRPQMARAFRPAQPGVRMRAQMPQVRASQSPRLAQPARRATRMPAPAQKSTSLIVLSDSDDEIEMIVIEKGGSSKNTAATPAKPLTSQVRMQKPAVTVQSPVESPKSVINSQIVRRMNQGGVSITPLKQAQAQRGAVANNRNNAAGATPQLVVVVNETGSHYALALPNGSKLILTPEQVAQIRASNGGNLSV